LHLYQEAQQRFLPDDASEPIKIDQLINTLKSIRDKTLEKYATLTAPFDKH